MMAAFDHFRLEFDHLLFRDRRLLLRPRAGVGRGSKGSFDQYPLVKRRFLPGQKKVMQPQQQIARGKKAGARLRSHAAHWDVTGDAGVS